nr:leucine-rich repeat-containing protein 10B-like [Paramormyrops kingsleyae]
MGNSSKKEAAEGGEGDEVEEEMRGAGEEAVEEEAEEEVVVKKKDDDEPDWDLELPPRTEDCIESEEPFLDLSYIKMTNLPTRICSLTFLEKLFLCNNRLQTLPKSLAQLQGLRLLALDQNKMDDMPVVVCELVNLTHLYLSNNKLMTLPVEMVNLKNLRCLWLDGNFFLHFPRLLLKLPNLSSLQLGDNMIRDLPNSLCRMEKLRGLWLYGNRFTKFPKVLMHMENLESLDMDHNKMSSLPDLDHLPALHLFSYDQNPIKVPPKVREGVVLVGAGARDLRDAKKKKMKAEKETAAVEAMKQAEIEAKMFLKIRLKGLPVPSSKEQELEQELEQEPEPEPQQEPVIHGILKNSSSDRRNNGVADRMVEGVRLDGGEGPMDYQGEGEQEELLYDEGGRE